MACRVNTVVFWYSSADANCLVRPSSPHQWPSVLLFPQCRQHGWSQEHAAFWGDLTFSLHVTRIKPGTAPPWVCDLLFDRTWAPLQCLAFQPRRRKCHETNPVTIDIHVVIEALCSLQKHSAHIVGTLPFCRGDAISNLLQIKYVSFVLFCTVLLTYLHAIGLAPISSIPVTFAFAVACRPLGCPVLRRRAHPLLHLRLRLRKPQALDLCDGVLASTSDVCGTTLLTSGLSSRMTPLSTEDPTPFLSDTVGFELPKTRLTCRAL